MSVRKRVGNYSESIVRLKREKQLSRKRCISPTRYDMGHRLMVSTVVRVLKGLCLRGALVLFLLADCGASAQQEMTADELISRGLLAYSHGRFNESRALFQQFLNDFGGNEEAAQARQRIKPLLALSCVQTKALEDALPLIEESLAIGSLDPKLSEELTFWKGVCEFDGSNYEAARQTFLSFREKFPKSAKATEAMVMVGTTFLVSGDEASAVDYFARVRPLLQGFERGRVVLLELNSLVTVGRLDEAKNLALSEYNDADNILQIAAYQTLLLNLGARFLDQGQLADAISCLQRVWSRERLMRHQEKRLETLEYQLEAAQQRRSDLYRQIQLGQMIMKVQRELANFQKIESFDAATRMRLARAYQERQRYREAALVMQDIVDRLPPDALLEQASLNLVQCWMQAGHWRRAIDAADQFARKFPTSAERPLALFMKGQAQQEDHQYKESVETFGILVKGFPKAELAPRATFMAGFGELLQENYLAALDAFEALPRNYRDTHMVETALYWKGMALSLAKQHEQSRAVMAEYLADYKNNGRYLSEATFRRAYSAQAMKDYATSIPELEAYLRDFPESENSEALILLGDALMATGRIDEGISRLKQIKPDERKFYEEGWFKIGKALRLQEKIESLRNHMEKFRTENPKSPRVAEAVYWIGWTHMQAGNVEEAREIYWKTISELGNNPEALGIEDLFLGLRRLYSGENDSIPLDLRMTRLLENANNGKQDALAVRLLWAQARQVKGRDPVKADLLYFAGARRVNARTASPVLLADFADALRSGGEPGRAQEMYRELLKWNPRAVVRDRAYAGLGLLAMKLGNHAEALKYFDKFERHAADSNLFGEVMLAKADLLAAENHLEEAGQKLDTLMKSPSTSSREKAEALLAMGNLMMKQKKFSLAVAYFQRVYVMYGRWRPLVARAYLLSGEAFEALDDRTSAVRTYQEMLNIKELAATPEGRTARKRLESLNSAAESKNGAA
jgi:tetratricopeptide (TPR) repeat protein